MAKLLKFAKLFPFNNKLPLRNRPRNRSKLPVLRGVSPIIQVAHAVIWEVLRRNLTYQKLYDKRQYDAIDEVFETFLERTGHPEAFNYRYRFNVAANQPFFRMYLNYFLPVPCILRLQKGSNSSLGIIPGRLFSQIRLYAVQNIEASILDPRAKERVWKELEKRHARFAENPVQHESMTDLFLEYHHKRWNLFDFLDIKDSIKWRKSSHSVLPPDLISKTDRFIESYDKTENDLLRLAYLFPKTNYTTYSDIRNELFANSIPHRRAKNALERNITQSPAFRESNRSLFQVRAVPGLEESDTHAFFDLYGKILYYAVDEYFQKKTKALLHTNLATINRNLRRVLVYTLKAYTKNEMICFDGKTRSTELRPYSVVPVDEATFEIRANIGKGKQITVYTLYILNNASPKSFPASNDYLVHIAAIDRRYAEGYLLKAHYPAGWKA